MNNDLGFLLIFIVLPTVLIVSGFWLILFVRNDGRVRGISDPSMVDSAETSAVIDSGAEVPALDSGAPEYAAKIAVPEPTAGMSEEFWTPELSLEDEPIHADIDKSDKSSQLIVELEPEPENLPVALPPLSEFDDTTNLPQDDDEPDQITVTEAETDSDADEDDRQQRRPAARMVPSTENVRRRIGASLRRPPAIGRSTLKDEDTVERPDGS